MSKLPDQVIIILVLLAAAFSVTCGYAISRQFNKDDEGPQAMSPEQESYMREVRKRNQEMNFGEADQRRWAGGRRGLRHDQHVEAGSSGKTDSYGA